MLLNVGSFMDEQVSKFTRLLVCCPNRNKPGRSAEWILVSIFNFLFIAVDLFIDLYLTATLFLCPLLLVYEVHS